MNLKPTQSRHPQQVRMRLLRIGLFVLLVNLFCQPSIVQHANGLLLPPNRPGGEHERQFSGDLESDDPNEDFSQLAESFSVSAAAAAAVSSQNVSPHCERIRVEMCSSMFYNFTMMTNFFEDSSQIEVAERAKLFRPLVESRCSRHLLTYLCELLAPVCAEKDATDSFKVYPCRNFCRQVKQDCHGQLELMPHKHQLMKAFQCDLLEFESNGGRGPCHETSDIPPGNSMSSGNSMSPTAIIQNKQQLGKHSGPSYNRPRIEDLDTNVPPFITDNTPIDAQIIKPSSPTTQSTQQHPENHDQDSIKELHKIDSTKRPGGQSGFLAQVQMFCQQLALSLVRYSNLLSVLTLFFLVLLLNAERLKRFKCYLGKRLGSSSSSKSTGSSSDSSSGGSQRKLAATSTSQSRHLFGQAHTKLTMSPSSSSRSLMLIASDGKRGHPRHKLVNASEFACSAASLEPSQKLLHAGLDRRTLINVNGTLERQNQHQNRYHMMQSIRGCAVELASKHQYDYIQVGDPMTQSARHDEQNQQPHQNEPQLYSNILLSSPSHQVLLFGDHHAQQQLINAEQPVSPQIPPPTQPARSHFMTAANFSPYASANPHSQLGEQLQRSFQRRPSGGSSRYRRTSNTGGGAISSASSTADSSSNSFSPPESSSGNPLLGGGGQFTHSPRNGRIA